MSGRLEVRLGDSLAAVADRCLCSVIEDARDLSEQAGARRDQELDSLARSTSAERPVVVSGAAVAMTVKVPEEVAQQLRQHARATNSTIGEVIARALAGLLARERRRG